ncbi:hypothetical protein BDQ12DRAFT_735423 [Crucibulum laeve]|uniref:G-protein coupled receptors family 1 profile domain-containing protein n=1 Tax=Crucibulum laeve TaxID=68775 RepID=A0A5C3M019_9AGAR|nr:hypothetical protein BDQ12DRAFT_735423 [Crucibulum laeve]
MANTTPEQNEVSIFVEAIFYGLYLATLLHCMRWMLYENEGWKLKKRISIQWTMLISTVAIFVCSFVNIILILTNVTQSIHPKPVTPSTLKINWEAVVICATTNVSALIADCVLIYRCWVVYSRSRKVVIFPIILWLGGLVCVILQGYSQIVHTKAVITGWEPALTPTIGLGVPVLLTPFWASTIVLNLYTTSMIVYRIWTAAWHENAEKDSLQEFKSIIHIIIESGALYLVITIAHFVVWFTPHPFAIVMMDGINLPIIGIAFNLILIRTSERKVDGLKKRNPDLESEIKFSSAPPVESVKLMIEPTVHPSRTESMVTS